MKSLYIQILKTFKFISTLIIFLVPLSAKADIYEYINEDGQAIYSDHPSDERYVLIIQELSTTEVETKEIKTGNLSENYIAQNSIQTPTEFLQHIETISTVHKIDPDLIHAVIYVESAYKQHAKSSKGAIGLMQLMPATAKRMGVKDINNTAQNIEGGAKYLRHLLNMFENDTRLALAAYNAGEQSVIRFGKRIPPYKETQVYVPKVMRIYEALRKQRAQIPNPL